MARLALAGLLLVVGDPFERGERVAVVVAPDRGARQQADIVMAFELGDGCALAQSAAGMPSIVSPDQLAEPPKCGSSSARMTRAP